MLQRWADAGRSKLAVLMGNGFFDHVHAKVVIDLGGGEGAEAIEIAQRGAALVIGVDIREDFLRAAAQQAVAAQVVDRCEFTQRPQDWPTLSSQ